MNNNTAQQAEDLRYISNPMLWFTMLCPMKRMHNNRRELAYLAGDGPILYHGNMFDTKIDDLKETFESYRAIISAGWEVD